MNTLRTGGMVRINRRKPAADTSGDGLASRHRVTLVTRAGCHLCQDAETSLRRLAAELGFGYEEVDVDGSVELRDSFSDRVPVILIDGKEHGYWRLEEARFRTALNR